MHVSYFENDNESEVNITKGEWHLEAERRDDRITLTVREASHDEDGCSLVFASLRECFTCEQWERLICELSRVHCGRRECEPCEEREEEREKTIKVIVFDQDECEDERPQPKSRTRKS